jgi:HSP20 family molecular chaperone IbpA
VSNAETTLAKMLGRMESSLMNFMEELGVKVREARQMFPTKVVGGPYIYDWNPNVDSYELDNEIVIQVNLPGVPEDQVIARTTCTILSTYLSGSSEVRANHALVIAGHVLPTEDQTTSPYFRNERPYGNFSRMVRLPKDLVDVTPETNIEARLEGGVLEIRVQLLICSIY